MTKKKNLEKIEQLRKEQDDKKKQIKKLKKRRLNDLFVIIMPLLILILLGENYIGKFFSTSKTFIYFLSSGIIMVVGVYLLINQLKVNKLQKGIDNINNELYKLMKLESKE